LFEKQMITEKFWDFLDGKDAYNALLDRFKKQV
jgi:hypothetical protein